MERLEAFRDTPPKKKEEKIETAATTPLYEPKAVLERYEVGANAVELDSVLRCVTIKGQFGEISLEYEAVPDLVAFLAWAMRARMEDADER